MLINEKQISWDQIVERKGKQQNTRTEFDPVKMQELADSIADPNIGLIQAITLRQYGAGYILVAGERRVRAMRDYLKWPALPPGHATIKDARDGDSDEDLSSDDFGAMLAENSGRVDLSHMDQARAFQRAMLEYGWSMAETARKAGVGPGKVATTLSLLKLAPEFQNQITSGDLPIGHGEIMSTLPIPLQRAAWRIYTKGYYGMDKFAFANEVKKLQCSQLDDQLELFALADEIIKELPSLDGVPYGKNAVIVGIPPLPDDILKPGEIGAKDRVGAIMMRYVDALWDAGNHREAATVAAAYEALVRAKKCLRAVKEKDKGWV